jgi:hypothetical protein
MVTCGYIHVHARVHVPFAFEWSRSRGQQVVCGQQWRAEPWTAQPTSRSRGQQWRLESRGSKLFSASFFSDGGVVSCNTLNLGVDFFLLFPHQIRALPLFSLFSSLSLDLFQSYNGIRLEISCKAEP